MSLRWEQRHPVGCGILKLLCVGLTFPASWRLFGVQVCMFFRSVSQKSWLIVCDTNWNVFHTTLTDWRVLEAGEGNRGETWVSYAGHESLVEARKTGILPSSLNLVPFLNLESLSKKCWNVTWVWWWCHQTGFLLIVSSQRFELRTEGSEHSCVPLGLTSDSPWWATCSSCA